MSATSPFGFDHAVEELVAEEGVLTLLSTFLIAPREKMHADPGFQSKGTEVVKREMVEWPLSRLAACQQSDRPRGASPDEGRV